MYEIYDGDTKISEHTLLVDAQVQKDRFDALGQFGTLTIKLAE